jgi:hypothetical protein
MQAYRERQGARSHIDLIHGGTEPGRLDVLLFDAGIGQTLLEGLGHQTGLIDVPTLAVSAASHTKDRNLILNSCSHNFTSYRVILIILSLETVSQ